VTDREASAQSSGKDEVAVSIPAIRRGANVPSVIAAQIEKMIATGQILPGSKLPPERDLAGTMNVSRSTLREAMSELERKRLIERSPGRGTVVLGPPPEVWDLRSMTAESSPRYVAELRYAIEPEIARLAAVRATPANIIQLRDVLSLAHEDLRKSESLKLDIEFHLLLAQSAQNPLMSSLCALASDWTKDERAHTHSNRSWRRLCIDGHRAIFESVEAHDPDTAHQAMFDHLFDVRRRISEATGAHSAG
jgi:DNA-binding FadR family transcriptional regulator